MKKGTIKLLCVLVMMMAGCIDPYNPPQLQMENSYLVVDGYVNLEEGTASIALSRTKNLSEDNSVVPQSSAQVRVQVEGGATYSLIESGAGNYLASGLDLKPTDRCKLLIKSEGLDYESDLVTVMPTPEIDSVTFASDNTGVTVEVTTHDPAKNTWYYMWQYEETAKYKSKFQSSYYYRGPGDFAYRPPSLDIYTCWKTIPSTTILVGTSKTLTDDVIYKFPVAFNELTSWKFEYRYSILVKQVAIEEDMYNYWIQIQKNTESLGTLFDPQPSQVTGNLHCITKPAEPVLGYFSVRSITEKRIYIDPKQIPRADIINGYEQCLYADMDTLLFSEYEESAIAGYLLVDAVYPPMGTEVIGYTTHSSSCIDCRLRHEGTTEEPEWWEE